MEWLNTPLACIDTVLAAQQQQPPAGGAADTAAADPVPAFFAPYLASPEAFAHIPSLNDVPTERLRPNTLVRFRGMVQDLFDPEFYPDVYEEVHTATGQRRLRCGRYRDVVCLEDGVEVDYQSPRSVPRARNTMYCVPVPGETAWAKEAWVAAAGAAPSSPTARAPSSGKRQTKRSMDDDDSDEDDDAVMDTSTDAAPGQATATAGLVGAADPAAPSSTTDPKRARVGQPGPAGSSDGVNLQFPLPGEVGPAVMVKVYNDESLLKVNDIAEFVGVLVVDPLLSEAYDAAPEDHHPLTGFPEEVRAHAPPPSLVARLHCVALRPLQHAGNPALPPAGPTSLTGADFTALREQTVAYLAVALGGDRLAAEHVLLHLVANVFGRPEGLVLGNTSLNLTGMNNDLVDCLAEAITNLMPKAFLLPMSLEFLNTHKAVPKKNHVTNRLEAGMLQLSAGTQLMLDETKLQPGQLLQDGVANVQAFAVMISRAVVPFDYQFSQIEIPVDIPTLVLSEGKTMLPVSKRLRVQPQQLPTVPATGNLHALRAYLAAARELPFDMNAEICEAIQQDFVQMRQANKDVQADTLHALLVDCRFHALTKGEQTPSMATWTEVRGVAGQRAARA